MCHFHFGLVLKSITTAVSFPLCKFQNQRIAHYQTLIIAILCKTCSAVTRQCPPSLLHESTRETKWPALITTLCGNLHAIGNHADRLALRVFEFECWLIARECIVVAWQIDDSRPTRVVAVEEGWTLVESFAGERGSWWNNRHARQACTERLGM